MILRTLAPIALLVLCASAAVQERAAPDRPSGPPIVSQSELVLEQFPVRNVDPDELFQVAENLQGRTYLVREANALQRSLRMLGTTILVYDTKEQIQRVRELLTKLDVDTPDDAASAWETVEYRPRFVSLDTVVSSIKNSLEHYSRVEERGLVVLRGPRDRLESVQALLKRVDIPQRQVLLTCQLVEYGDSARGPELPRELSDNLEKLLHVGNFAQVGMAMLRTSVSTEKEVKLQVESTGKRYQFSFVPVAFDESTGALSVTNCTLVEQAEKEMRELFRTSVVLSSGEYTVLAATGATPRLLVVRVTPQG
jgi:hypothetical protein